MKDQINTIREALTAAANLIAHQYTGTSLGMTALQDASDDCLEALTALAQIEADHFTAADMADAQAKSFRDGVASVTAGQEPVGYLHPQARQRLENGETVAFRKTPYAGEPTLAVYVGVAPVAQQPQKLEDIEQYRMQMAGICTAAIGYWKEGDSIHPDYDTPALREVAKMYAKYDALYKAQQPHVPEADCGNITPAELAKRIERGEKWQVVQLPQARQLPFREWTTDYVRDNLHKLKQPQAKAVPSDEELEVLIYEHTKLNPNQADDRELIGYIINAVRAAIAQQKGGV